MTSVDTCKKTLKSELEQVSLEVPYWTEILKTKCGITQCVQLRFASESELKQVQKCTRYNWEKEALSELFGCSYKRMEKEKQNDKISLQLLADIQQLRQLGLARNDTTMQRKEDKLKQVLQIPDHDWKRMCSDESFDGVISHLSSQLGKVTELTVDRNDLSPTELIKSASGGLALRGILVTNEIESCTKMRKMVVEAPEFVQLHSPVASHKDDIVEFSSRKRSDRFSHSLDMLGYSIAISAKGGSFVFQAEAGFQKDHQEESENESESHSNEVYISREITSCVPTAVCELDKSKLKLSESVVTDLKNLELILQGGNDSCAIQDKGKKILEKYGSHVNVGFIEFGGIYRWRASYSKESSSHESKGKQIVQDALSAFVSMSYTGFGITAGGPVSGNHVKSHSYVTATYDESDLSRVTLNVIKKGGPQEITSLPVWKIGLLKFNQTWAVIDRGTSLERDFVGLWELIRINSIRFNNASALANTIKQAWKIMNKATITSITNFNDSLTTFSEFLDRNLTEWNKDPDFVNNVADYLQQMHDAVEACCTVTGDSKVWANKLLTNQPLAEFLNKLLQVKKQIPANATPYVQLHMHVLLKRAGGQAFSLKNELVQWLLQMEQKSDEVNSIINAVDIKDIAGLLVLIQKSLLPAMHSLLQTIPSDTVDIQATKDLALAINKLCGILKDQNSNCDLLLLHTALSVLNYDSAKSVFSVLVNVEKLEKFVTKIDSLLNEYRHFKDAEITRKLAFLISGCISSLPDNLDEAGKEETFTKMISLIQHLLPQDMNSFVKQVSSSTPYKWQSLQLTMDEVMKGNRGALSNRRINMNDLKNVLTPTNNPSTMEKPPIKLLHNASKLVTKLGLQKYYPSKISLQDVMAISEKSDNQYEELPWLILKKLIMLDYSGRESEISKVVLADEVNNSSEEAESNEDDFSFEKLIKDAQSEEDTDLMLNPLDVFVVVYCCCDFILRQMLVQKMFTCRLAIPFLIPDLSKQSPLFSLWAMRGIITEYKGQREGSIMSSVVQQPIKTLTFLRLGRPSFSKSSLVNKVLSDKAHQTFWNRECLMGDTEKKIATGLVEAQWYLPAGKETDIFKDIVMFLNLRGNATLCINEVRVLTTVSNIIICCLDISGLENQKNLETLKQILSEQVKLILILSTKDPATLNKRDLERQSEHFKSYFGKNISGTNIIFTFKGSKVKTAGDLKQEIKRVTNKWFAEEKGHVLENVCAKFKANGIVIDEDEEKCKKAKQMAQQVISCMGDRGTHECKTSMLPLQGDMFHKWSKLLKEKRRSGRKDKKSTVIHEMAKIQEKMTLLRQTQAEHSKSLSSLMKTFLQNLLRLIETPMASLYLQWLKLYLDEKCRKTIPGLREEYQKKWLKFNSVKATGDRNTDELKRGRDTSEKNLSNASFGLEHMFRELAQIYEAAVESEKELEKGSEQAVHQLPIVAAKLLLKGQPLEIMDGDAANVPLSWIKAVFSSLKEVIGDKKLFIISVLGVQSSGKSTLLNTMFGLQFAASAGRCTRGAFMQLLEVKNNAKEFDYVLVVDTEGLRAPELGQTKYTHDNELATFVIGLGDVTIINVKGENMSEMSDVLQIAVHAFLRMKLVNGNFQLRRSCVFIHQNVPAVNAKEMMQQGSQKLQESLDEMTVEASNIENIADIHSFNQVIDFDRDKHIWYFSDLWNGDPPMAPVNPGYSEKVQNVKQCLLNDLSKGQTFLRFTDMVLRIEDIWNAVLSDDFVFSFRSSLAAKAYNNLESNYFEITWKVECNMMKWLKSKAIGQLERCTTYKDLEDCSATLMIEAEREMSIMKENADEKLKKFFAEDSLKDIIIDWQIDTLNSLTRDTNEFLFRAKREITQTKDTLRIDLLQRVKQKKHEQEIIEKAKELAYRTRGKSLSIFELKAKFDSVCAQWLNDLAARAEIQPINIEVTVQHLLFQHMKGDTPVLRKELTTNLLSIPLETNILEGSISDNDIQDSHISVRTTVSQNFTWFIKGNNATLQCKKTAVKAVNAIMRSIDIYLTDLSKQDTRFQESFAATVIKYVIDGVQKHNKQYTKQYPFTLLPNLKVKLAVHACRFAITKFMKIQEDYDNKHSIAKKVEKYKATAWNLFKNMVTQATKEVIAADLLYGCLSVLIKKAVVKEMPSNVVEEMTSNFSHSKYHLIVAILDDIAVKGSFENYRSFLTNARDFSLKWITTFTNETFFSRNDSSMTRYAEQAQAQIHELIKAIQVSVQVATSSQSKGLPSIQKWCETFTATLKGNLQVSMSDLRHVTEENVKDFNNLERLFVEQLKNMKDSVMETFKSETAASIKWEGTTPYRQIINKMWGCEAQCPFCNEPCQRTDSNHISKGVSHQCIQHRPSGVGGDRWDEDYRKDKLVVESCNFFVQWKDVRFNCRDCKFECRKSGKCSTFGTNWQYHTAIEYKTFLPEWDIAPSTCMESSKYWMWFMVKYKRELKDMYNAQLPDIPSGWNSITIKQAKDSLRMYNN